MTLSIAFEFNRALRHAHIVKRSRRALINRHSQGIAVFFYADGVGLSGSGVSVVHGSINNSWYAQASLPVDHESVFLWNKSCQPVILNEVKNL